MTTPRKKARPRAKTLPLDACPQCGTAMKEAHGVLRLPVNGEEIAVAHAAHLRCPRCHDVVLRLEDARRLGEDAIAAYRKKHGLLSAEDIRAIRERFNLTQADLARLLYLGQNTLSRWECTQTRRRKAADRTLTVSSSGFAIPIGPHGASAGPRRRFLQPERRSL